jgi:hypothetical protein
MNTINRELVTDQQVYIYMLLSTPSRDNTNTFHVGG